MYARKDRKKKKSWVCVRFHYKPNISKFCLLLTLHYERMILLVSWSLKTCFFDFRRSQIKPASLIAIPIDAEFNLLQEYMLIYSPGISWREIEGVLHAGGGGAAGGLQGKTHLKIISIENNDVWDPYCKNDAGWGAAFCNHPHKQQNCVKLNTIYEFKCKDSLLCKLLLHFFAKAWIFYENYSILCLLIWQVFI